MVVLHYTAMGSAEAALERLCDTQAEVSAHWLIARDGRLFRLVPEEARAWHAGAGAWGQVRDVNSRSIGIEIDNDGQSPFAAPAMATLEALLAEIMQRWAIRPERVIGHADMAPGRKPDPGPRFDWLRLARAGLSVWPAPGREPRAADEGAFLAAARAFGYRAPEGCDDPAGLILRVFRARFRPFARGPLSPADMAAIADLAARFPVDREAPAS
jgi:N-acetylmuramoyl-L-alanine amidase